MRMGGRNSCGSSMFMRNLDRGGRPTVRVVAGDVAVACAGGGDWVRVATAAGSAGAAAGLLDGGWRVTCGDWCGDRSFGGDGGRAGGAGVRGVRAELGISVVATEVRMVFETGAMKAATTTPSPRRSVVSAPALFARRTSASARGRGGDGVAAAGGDRDRVGAGCGVRAEDGVQEQVETGPWQECWWRRGARSRRSSSC